MTFLTLVFALVPGFAWLVFYLQEDPHPEPRRLIALTFLAGMASAVLAFEGELLFSELIKPFGIAMLSPLSIIALAFIEEGAKFLAAYLAIHKNPAFDEPVDAMIYMIVAALGFATLENLGAVSGAHSDSAIISAAFEAATLRFIGATLLHTLASGILGYYWAMSIREFFSWQTLLFGFILAGGLHAAFNYLILSFGNLVNSVIFVVLVGFFAFSDFEKLKRSPV